MFINYFVTTKINCIRRRMDIWCKILFMYGFLMLNNSTLWSQNFGYQKWITLKSDTTVLDSNSIVFGRFNAHSIQQITVWIMKKHCLFY